ncbi:MULTISPECIES: disulfide bond formation protein B [unclassified Novosphingobium]|uniref:disulfide bond formation protein B n=1 Tax=unclassified Novosphingobium TaxID=2644732 RepID=UPI00086AE3F3|nr:MULTISPECIES: disulfide bond formation protein B [unclassified Novosphingobium]MBN9142711.1 disulfide bond formation protein B [Novosphingobium sp.]MDR6705795.1 disulfide bond formation protein DsbB [Novosphingobium sp. 1748]ODU85113.1 MAG: disulfide bond formation protein [Novosphingobium sp. SCN 63-17]OJX89110.1 MAG: disulfide bond formation protein B [Novosphingobium sp. 63-713]
MKNLGKANLVALAVPLALLGGAYGFQYIGGLVPCEMCWWQRYAHFAALGLAVAAFVLPVKRLFVALSGLALAAASAIGGYHAGVEYGWWKGLTECTTTVSFSNGGDPLAAIMAAPVIRCDVVQWKLMGISMAGYDFLISGAAALVVFALMARKER